MPFHINQISQLRKSEKNKATDILFTISGKKFKKLNLHNTQKQFKFELIDYSEFYKIKIIKHIKNATKKTIPEIQKMLESMPMIVSKQFSSNEAKNLESKLTLLNCKVRIF